MLGPVLSTRDAACFPDTAALVSRKPVLTLFNPCGAATWLLTEIEPDDPDIAWGVCDLGMGFPEFGTVSLAELAFVRGRVGLSRKPASSGASRPEPWPIRYRAW